MSISPTLKKVGGWILVAVVVCALWHPIANRILIPVIELISNIVPKWS